MGKHIGNESRTKYTACEYFGRFWKASKDGANLAWENNTLHRRKDMTCETLLESVAIDSKQASTETAMSATAMSADNLIGMQIWHEGHSVCQLLQCTVCKPGADLHGDNSVLAVMNC